MDFEDDEEVEIRTILMLDDDIECFGEVEEGKTIQKDGNVLVAAYDQLKIYGPASMYSLELRQFAWSAKEVQRDKIAMQCVMFDLQHCQNIEYDLRLKIREDYDHQLPSYLQR